jgi:hypothetical protein
MSIFPITPLVCRVRGLVLQTFDVSEQAAEDYAAMVVALAEDHGGPDKAGQLDWDYRIKKDLGEGRKWRWRSEEERVRFEAAEKQKYQAYDFLISRPHV